MGNVTHLKYDKRIVNCILKTDSHMSPTSAMPIVVDH
jgi:hypothetical protein